MAGIPGKGARIAGQDYCFGSDSDSSDLDLGPGGLIVEQGNPGGGSAGNDQESKIKAGS